MNLSNLTTSARGINLIKRWEGFRAGVYLCPAGKLTVGWGHVVLASDNLALRQIVTIDQAAAFLAADLQIAEAWINQNLAPAKINGLPLNQNEFDALVSFCFNLGAGALAKSTLYKKLIAGDHAGAANQFTKWCYIHVRGKAAYSAGLYARRADEFQLFKEVVNA